MNVAPAHRRMTAFALLLLLALVPISSHAGEGAMPRYSHIFMIIEENKEVGQVMSHPQWAPAIHRLAAEYGQASEFYAETHPSEGNYIAMLGGDTFEIQDDDAYFCKPHLKNTFCANSDAPNYVDHSLKARSLMDQLAKKGLSWKAYLEDIPSPGSLMPLWPTKDHALKGLPSNLYAAKHNGFVSFKNVEDEKGSQLQKQLVGFAQLDADLAADHLPNYAHIVPNQCNEMHGLSARSNPDVAPDCDEAADLAGLIRRGDAEIGLLVGMIQRSKVWNDSGNTAIVITFDENDSDDRTTGPQGCCGYEPSSVANYGGGHILTLVVTNHGPRHIIDPTPYNHYSLLRTTEAAFGIDEYLGHAADAVKGVVTMTPLF
jgi:phosphatidylinositol-3-phosphatase